MVSFVRRFQKGLTLIEVLVAVIVLAIGVLGVAALQMHALRNVKVSGDIQVVTARVNELVERMRLNIDNAAAYDGLTNTSCSTVQSLADEDFCTVLDHLKDEMPAASVSLSVTSCAAAGALCVIQAQWTSKQTYGVTAASSPNTYQMDVQL